jgi:hypothetical protein
MATFCGNCGSPLDGKSSFCQQCGTAVAGGGNQPPPSPSPAYAAPIVAAKKGNSALKIVVILLCCLFVGGMAVVGGLYYVAHRVKQTVMEKARENGVDLSSLGSSETDASANRRLPKACELLSKEEVSRLLGEPIERAKAKGSDCEYYGPAGLSAKLAEEETSEEVKRAQTPGADAQKSALALQRMLNRVGAQAGNTEAGPTGSAGELPLLVLGVSPNGKSTMNALALTKGIFGAASKAVGGQQGEKVHGAAEKSGADVFVGKDVPDLGDKAMWTPGSGLYVLQGNTLIKVNPGVFPGFSAKAMAVARAVLPKLKSS